MLLTQKYHSALDIDPEFIPSLEELLCECIPSFEWIKNFEVNSPNNIHFAYYLFFGTHHNSPVGFAQIEIEDRSEKEQRSLSSFFNKKKEPTKIKNAYWKMPGSLNEGIIFEPMYIKDATFKTKSLFAEYLAREDIQLQSLCFSKALSELKDIDAPSKIFSNEKIIPNTLIKSHSNYEGYLHSLKDELQVKIKKMWRTFYKDEMKLGEYQSLKEIFSYRKESAETYKELKSSTLIKKYKDERCTYLTIEKNNKVLAIVFYLKGHGHHYFFDSIILDSSCDELLVTQLVIMKFYETSQCDRLHLLNKTENTSLFESQGFSTRSQIYLSINQN